VKETRRDSKEHKSPQQFGKPSPTHSTMAICRNLQASQIRLTYMNFLNCFLSFGASAMLCVLLGRKRNSADCSKRPSLVLTGPVENYQHAFCKNVRASRLSPAVHRQVLAHGEPSCCRRCRRCRRRSSSSSGSSSRPPRLGCCCLCCGGQAFITRCGHMSKMTPSRSES
jgi:hypothetical protein